MRHLCIGIAFFLPIAVSILNSLSIIWLARRVNRDLYPPKAEGLCQVVNVLNTQE